MAKKKPKQRARGKIGATDVPSWVNDTSDVGEAGKDFAKRMMDDRYGEGNWPKTSPGSEYNRIKK